MAYFRRRFRKISHYAPNEQKLNSDLHPKLTILNEIAAHGNEDIAEIEVHIIYQKLKRLIKISEAFVLARNFFK